MVQMKVSLRSYCMLILLHLYIPHGSDESGNTCRRNNRHCDLYIPHGSDESASSSSFSPQSSFFISHMVQMKDNRKNSSRNLSKYFISHMVQMKAAPPPINPPIKAKTNFISHMVQMKVLLIQPF